MMATHHAVIVIGAGQAGLAMGALLQSAGIDYLIVGAERRIGDTWRERYDSLRLFTPRWLNRLPQDDAGKHPDPNGFPGKDEIADYLEAYANRKQLSLQLETRIMKLQKEGDLFLLTTTRGSLTACAVVIATGPFQKPRIPEFASHLSPSVLQMHTAYYRNPTQLQPGSVVIVGGGNSAAQIALELADQRDVHLASGPLAFMPATILGKSVFWWFQHLGIYHAHVESRLGGHLSQRPDPVIGMELKGHLRSGHIKQHARVIDACHSWLTFADGSSLDVGNVLWATGFGVDYPWLKIPGLLDENGRPVHRRGTTNVSGIFFLGLPWQYTRKSALIGGVGADAAYLLGAIQSHLS